MQRILWASLDAQAIFQHQFLQFVVVIGFGGRLFGFLCYKFCSLLPARASEQGNVIGSVRIYIYIYIIYVYKKNCN